MTGHAGKTDSPGSSTNPDELRGPGFVEVRRPASFSQELSGEFNGVAIRYRAIAGETYIREDSGADVASYFTVAYLRSDVEDSACRPITFIFNGGPGSSTLWLHMGAFGPRRVVVPSEARNAGAPPYPIVHNALAPLDVSDLVFIDPIGTGFSCALGGKDPKKYWGLLEDASSIADFIQSWITEHKRWNSPKYVAGESYGTARACLLAEILSERYIALNGIILISAVLDYQNSRPRSGDGGILSYASFIPSYAASAWYHKKVNQEGRTLASFLNDVRAFARTDYALALISNYQRIDAHERADIISKLASYTGLKDLYIERSKLRIPPEHFSKELLRDEGLVLGRLDARYVGAEPESAGKLANSDPTFDAIGGAFTAAVNVQLGELGVQMERPYIPITSNVEDSWNWSLQMPQSGGGYINVVPYLGRAMRRNDGLRVLVTSGYFDLATPFFGVENALSQDGVVHERIQYTYYEVGHMIFLHEPSFVRFAEDVRRFIQVGNHV